MTQSNDPLDKCLITAGSYSGLCLYRLGTIFYCIRFLLFLGKPLLDLQVGFCTLFFELMASLRKFVPLLDRVLVQRFVAETSTKGGILLPEKSVGKLSEGTVVSVGPGGRDQNGNTVPVSVKAGDKVLLPEYGGTKLEIEDQEYVIFRDAELIGKFEN
ncbi:10 kDa heat shock protein, mitochondrial-like isoform X1 [Hydractinia symbiolongicarpus]|uniref:10 kDa heat shock protein, mitochondrial-like isoform X1 n=1 Tax=Hydractinia symbiolongicarpus TaxID=13093 RepID=UPI002550D2BC|nr:10 kDa heat shock protein, mitochondrial-like isoform X1 [Hydractinia symbiolongicarpus]